MRARALAAAVLCTIGASAGPAGPAGAADNAAAAASCAPRDGLAFVCGIEHPEDLARIPDTPWLVASGFSPGAGISLVDTHSKTLRRWYPDTTGVAAADLLGYPGCPSAPDAARLNVQGLAIRSRAPHQHVLYAANHGGREAVEVFNVDATASPPTLSWIGCVPLPEGHAANAVAVTPDGSIFVTVLTRPGTTITDFVRGRKTGAIYEAPPGSGAFHLVRGTELPGNNGLETSRDGQELYSVAFGWHAVAVYSRHRPETRPRLAVAPGFMPDNIHWDGARLLLAGMQYDEPACGGMRAIINGVADDMHCHRGYVVAELDPRTLGFRIVAYGEPNADFNGVSAAVIVDDEVWLASYQADRLAYRPLPATGLANR